jgi:hypothetical protein
LPLAATPDEMEETPEYVLSANPDSVTEIKEMADSPAVEMPTSESDDEDTDDKPKRRGWWRRRG